MKKQFLFGMAAVAALCSCSNNEVMEAPESLQTPVTFGTYVGNSVNGRAAVIDLNGLKNGANTDEQTVAPGFGVFGYYTEQEAWSTSHTPNFMYNEKISWSTGDNKWGYTPLKYWPNNKEDKVSFFAYAPYDAGSASNFAFTTVGSMTAPQFTFTVNSDVKKQQDLLIAKQVNKVKQTTVDNAAITTSDKVDFSFEHALARIGFNVQAIVDNVNSPTTGTEAGTPTAGTLDNNTTISVEKVELIGDFYANATVDLSMAGENDDESHKRFANEKKITNLVENNSYDIAGAGVENIVGQGFTLKYNADNAISNFVPSTNSGATLSTSQTVNTTKQQLNANDSYIMVIPQNFAGGDKLQIRVTYTVTTTDSKLNGGESKITNIVTSSAFNYNFQRGKAYAFNLYLGMTSVKFAASITNWTTESTNEETLISVNVPSNK